MHEALRGDLEAPWGEDPGTVWTIGPYDMVLVVEVPDDEAAAVAIEHGAIGTIRSTTLRAFDSQEFGGIVQRLR